MTKHLLALCALGLSVSLMAPAQAALPATAKLMRSTGIVKLNGTPTQPGALLKAGDQLETAPHCRADVALSDGSAIRLNEGTTLTLTSLGDHVRLTLAKGGLLNVVHHGSDYQVISQGAVAAVRGTHFYLDSDGSQGPGHVCVCRGSVDITDPQTLHTENRTTSHHEAFSVGGGKLTPAPMRGHHDEDISALEHIAH